MLAPPSAEPPSSSAAAPPPKRQQVSLPAAASTPAAASPAKLASTSRATTQHVHRTHIGSIQQGSERPAQPAAAASASTAAAAAASTNMAAAAQPMAAAARHSTDQPMAAMDLLVTSNASTAQRDNFAMTANRYRRDQLRMTALCLPDGDLALPLPVDRSLLHVVDKCVPCADTGTVPQHGWQCSMGRPFSASFQVQLVGFNWVALGSFTPRLLDASAPDFMMGDGAPSTLLQAFKVAYLQAVLPTDALFALMMFNPKIRDYRLSKLTLKVWLQCKTEANGGGACTGQLVLTVHLRELHLWLQDVGCTHDKQPHPPPPVLHVEAEHLRCVHRQALAQPHPHRNAASKLQPPLQEPAPAALPFLYLSCLAFGNGFYRCPGHYDPMMQRQRDELRPWCFADDPQPRVQKRTILYTNYLVALAASIYNGDASRMSFKPSFLRHHPFTLHPSSTPVLPDAPCFVASNPQQAKCTRSDPMHSTARSWSAMILCSRHCVWAHLIASRYACAPSFLWLFRART